MPLSRPLHTYGQTGNRVTLYAPGGGPSSPFAGGTTGPTGASSADMARLSDLPDDAGLTLRYHTDGAVPGGAAVLLTVQEGIEDASFARQFYAPPYAQRVRLLGRLITVQAQIVAYSAYAFSTLAAVPAFGVAPNAACGVKVSVDAAGFGDTTDLAPWWFTPALVPASGPVNQESARFTGAGTLLDATLSLSTYGGAPVWLWIWDSLTVAAAISGVLPSLVPPMMLTAVGQNAALGDDKRPAAAFQKGLSWALSSSPTVALVDTGGSLGSFAWKGGF